MQVSPARLVKRIRLRPEHVILGVLSLLLVGLAVASLEWRIDGDLAWTLYISRLVDQHGLVPYRDIYVLDTPGTIFVNILIGRLIGYVSDFGARLVDLAYLAAISVVSWAWLRRLSPEIAWGAVVLFGLLYLESGVDLTLQKEYVLLLPVISALWVATAAPRLDDRARSFLVGLLFGFAATIKPHAALALPVVVVFMFLELKARNGSLPRRSIVWLSILAAGGAALPVAAAVTVLAWSGALTSYMDILAHYGPLYGQTTYQLIVVRGPERLDYLYSTLVALNGKQVWLIPTVVGVMVAFLPGQLDDRQRRLVGLATALLGIYFVYPALTGQFYGYHWLPFEYFLMALAALCFMPIRAESYRRLRAFPLLAVALALLLRFDLITGGLGTLNERYVLGHVPPPPQAGRSDQIAGFAGLYFAPGDKAQPLDWGNGAMVGLLLADAPPANRFVFDAPFFYETHSAYVQGLRHEFIRDLADASAPRWIVYVPAQRQLQGPGVDYEWPELQQTLDRDYRVAFLGPGLVIYRRDDSPPRGIILYPLDTLRDLSGFLSLPGGDILPLPEDQAQDGAALDAALADFVGRHALLTAEFLSIEVDSGPVEAWLSQNAFVLDRQQITTTVIANYVSQPGCAGPERAETATFGPAIQLDSSAAGLVKIGGEWLVCGQLVWQAAQPTDRSYHVAAHLLGPDGTLVAQHDGIPMAGLAPTHSWTPGKPVVDRFAIRLPHDLPPGEYVLNVVVYDPDSGQRLMVGGSDSLPVAHLTVPAP